MAVQATQGSSFWRVPPQADELVGREASKLAVGEALARPSCRLLTLLGIGGIGKTRLAVAVTETITEGFKDGVCFVDLTKVGHATEVASHIAGELNLQVDSRSADERLKAFLRPREFLLVLDNFEHVLPAAVLVADLLESCPRLRILATSREPLRLRWERRFIVEALEAPDSQQGLPVEALQANPSVALFVQRARAVDLRFAPDDEAVRDIAVLCAKLEGLPLAIELAAARTNVFSPGAILERLGDQRSFLRSSAPDAPDRHQSLDAMLEWSTRLLADCEREFFHGLSVFVGGFTLPAVEALVAEEGWEFDALDALASLVDKGLVRVEPSHTSEGRYRLLEPVRGYALEQLRATGQAEDAETAHAHYYLSLVEHECADLRFSGFFVFSPAHAAVPGSGAELQPWPLVLDEDYANIQAVLRWAEAHDPSILLRLAVALARYWWLRGMLPEGARWLESAIERNPEADATLRCRAFGGLGPIYRQQGEFDRAHEVMEQALSLCRTLDEPTLEMAQHIDVSGVLTMLQRLPEAITQVEEALQQARALGDEWGIAAGQAYLGLGEVARRRGKEAETLFSACFPVFRDLGDLRSIAVVEVSMARAISLHGEQQRALPFIRDGLRASRELDQPTLIPLVIEMAAGVLSQGGVHKNAARLLGAAEELRRRGYTRTPLEQDNYQDALATLRAALGEDTLASQMGEGQRLTGNQAIAEALALIEPMTASRDGTSTNAEREPEAQLSAREREVLALLVEGYANRTIGERLGISENTAKFHVTSILAKLGVSNRVEAVSLATRRGLV